MKAEVRIVNGPAEITGLQSPARDYLIDLRLSSNEGKKKIFQIDKLPVRHLYKDMFLVFDDRLKIELKTAGITGQIPLIKEATLDAIEKAK